MWSVRTVMGMLYLKDGYSTGYTVFVDAYSNGYALCVDGYSNGYVLFVDGYSNGYALFVDGYASTAFRWISRVKDWEKRSFPVSLGKDFSGVVVQTGQGVTHVKPGDEVRSRALNVTLQIKISSYTLC